MQTKRRRISILVNKNPVKCTSPLDNEYLKLVIFGAGGCGKSSLIIKFIENTFSDRYDPTVEDSYKKETTVDKKTITLDILDTAGQTEYKNFRESYIKRSQGFIICFSLTNKDSFDEVKDLLDLILQVKQVELEIDDIKATALPIVLVATKCDLENDRVVQQNEIQKLCESYGGLKCFETSAKLGVNIEECFLEVSKQVCEKVLKTDHKEMMKKEKCTIL